MNLELRKHQNKCYLLLFCSVSFFLPSASCFLSELLQSCYKGDTFLSQTSCDFRQTITTVAPFPHLYKEYKTLQDCGKV